MLACLLFRTQSAWKFNINSGNLNSPSLKGKSQDLVQVLAMSRIIIKFFVLVGLHGLELVRHLSEKFPSPIRFIISKWGRDKDHCCCCFPSSSVFYENCHCEELGTVTFDKETTFTKHRMAGWLFKKKTRAPLLIILICLFLISLNSFCSAFLLKIGSKAVYII